MQQKQKEAELEAEEQANRGQEQPQAAATALPRRANSGRGGGGGGPVVIARKGQRPITSYAKSQKFGKKSREQLAFDAEVTLFIATTGQSFNLMRRPGWIRFMNFCLPEVHIKSPSTIAQ